MRTVDLYPPFDLRQARDERDVGARLSGQDDLCRRVRHDQRTDDHQCRHGARIIAGCRYHLTVFLLRRYFPAIGSDQHRIGAKRSLSQGCI